MDWRDIDTSKLEGLHQLNRIIAERLGYSFEKDNPGWGETWYCTHPDGKRYECGVTPTKSLEWVWGTAFNENWFGLGDYTDDLNYAAKLPLPGDRVFIEIRVWDEGYASARVHEINPYNTMWNEKTEALARCKAWLDWTDARKE